MREGGHDEEVASSKKNKNELKTKGTCLRIEQKIYVLIDQASQSSKQCRLVCSFPEGINLLG